MEVLKFLINIESKIVESTLIGREVEDIIAGPIKEKHAGYV